MMLTAENTLSKIEAELITSEGEVLRPDRLCFKPDEILLIDYKTGQENNNKYFKQLHRYEQALLKMNLKNIRKYIVYIDTARVVEVK